MDKDKIIEIIEDKITDVEVLNREPRCTDEFYSKNDAKIEILEELLREIIG